MRDLAVLCFHLLATVARLASPGGLRAVVAESLLVKHQRLILNRSRQRAPNLLASDRIVAGVCVLFMRSARVIRSAIVIRPSTVLDFHRTLRTPNTDCCVHHAPSHRPPKGRPQTWSTPSSRSSGCG